MVPKFTLLAAISAFFCGHVIGTSDACNQGISSEIVFLSNYPIAGGVWYGILPSRCGGRNCGAVDDSRHGEDLKETAADQP